jgi:Transposase DNA-binding/Transposase Tn5 dimerisation domain
MEMDAGAWAEQRWGTCELGDVRRSARAVEIGRLMAECPGGSVPKQMGNWGQTLAAYRFLNNPHVTASALWEPHLAATRAAARAEEVVLFAHDWTTLDYTLHAATRGIGSVGSRSQRGLLLHSVVAVAPRGKRVLGLAHLQAIIRPAQREPPPAGRHRGPEGEAWETGVRAIGRPAAGVKWVHVSDRESEVYGYLAECVRQGTGFVVRACRNRKVGVGLRGVEAGRLMAQARQMLPKSGPRHSYTVSVGATKQAPARDAKIVLSWCKLSIPPPTPEEGQAILAVWVVRAWEEAPPSGTERVEWILLTSERIETATAATRVVEWYTCRWLVEDYHMCLKTGCRVEHSQLDDGADLQRLLGFVAPLAVRLLQLRQAVRNTAEAPALDEVDPLLVRLLAAKLRLPTTMSLAQFWAGVAQLGGYLGRKSDGSPGWRTLWSGWRTLNEYATGARLAGT